MALLGDGQRRSGTAALLTAAVFWVFTAGCGGDGNGSDAVETARPEIAFAPLVLLDPDERWRPMSAQWFIERSVLWFAEDHECPDREIAVGRTLGHRHDPVTDWIWHPVLGGKYWAYYRNPYDETCKRDRGFGAYADQRTRPHDSVDRPPGLHPGEGFYLDLVDRERGGPDSLNRATVYVERVEGRRGMLRLAYWMLFGMHAPPGRPAETHEGDWERFDVLLRRVGRNSYEPQALLLGAIDDQGASARPVTVSWSQVGRSDDTHPVIAVESGSHGLAPDDCARCDRWRTWRTLRPARTRPWHGFGGAWGEMGVTAATTGPLGPHGRWPTDSRD